MKAYITFFFLSLSASLAAQTGNYFLSHYAPSQEHFNNVCFDMIQDERGVMYFATNAGVMEFDGKNWDVLKGQSAVYTLHINGTDEIFWGGSNGFGKIAYNVHGFQEIILLSDSTSEDVFKIQSVKEEVFFLSEESIYAFNTQSQKFVAINSSEETGSFSGIFELYGVVFVNTADGGIFKIEKDKLVSSKLGIQNEVVFHSKIDDNYVIGTSDNKLYVLTETLQPKPIIIEDQNYVNASVIVTGSWVNRQLLALGTLRGGVVFINPITGKTQQIVNYATGLPDNEVFAMTPDRNQNIWVAHDYGFSRVSPFMPFHTFSRYPGLQGNPLCAYAHDASVYAGTSLGLFKLEKENVYDELVFYVDVEIKDTQKNEPKKSNASSNTTETTKVVDDIKPPAESKKRGLFGFLKKNKKDKETEQIENTEVAKSKESQVSSHAAESKTTAPKYKREKRTERVLRASQYVYREVKNIDSKVTQLVEVGGKLIASGLGGMYQVNGLESKSIHEEPVRFMYGADDLLFASTYDDKIIVLSYYANSWHQINSLNNLNDQINFMFEGKEGELWLCGLDKAFQLEFTNESIAIVRSLELENPDMEKTLGVSWDDNVMFVNPEGFFSFNRASKKITKVDSLPQPAQYFTQEGSILYRDQHGWSLTGKEKIQGNLKLLNLFNDLRFITTDHEPGNLWMITRNNELYKFFGDKISADEMAFPLFLKTVVNHDIRTGSRSEIHISEDKSAVTFEIVQPDYVSPEAVEFRYQLKGMNEQWSEWASTNNIIDFPYLPPGSYTLLVQSKNIFGRASELDPMTFEVLPPYWKRSWFYAMEFAILASLVLLSFRLNTKYRIVSRVLTLLTIILLIEFIQTVISATIHFSEESPVIDFITQVFVALLILPVEGYLRNLMFRSLDASSKFYEFLGSKPPPIIQKENVEEFEPSDRER
jgi:hypothetical protein